VGKTSETTKLLLKHKQFPALLNLPSLIPKCETEVSKNQPEQEVAGHYLSQLWVCQVLKFTRKDQKDLGGRKFVQFVPFERFYIALGRSAVAKETLFAVQPKRESLQY
jgi:hypothetical protein